MRSDVMHDAAAAVAAPAVAEVEWMVDNAEAWAAGVASIDAARRTIWLTQLALDPDCVVYPSGLADAPDRRTRLLIDALIDATARGVEVRVLLNASLLLDTAAPLRRFLDAAGVDRRRFRVRGMSLFPQLLHAKLLVVDAEEAHLVGSPFVNGYWDDPHHAPFDPRRPARELGGRPLHDVSTLVRGGPALRLATVFADLWNRATDVERGDEEPLLAPPHAPAADAAAHAAVRVARSLPARITPYAARGVTEIHEAILAAVAGARRFIYIEHQYLSSQSVVDALAEALRREPALEVLMVLNQNPDVTAYRGWQALRLGAAGLLDHERVGVFAVWSCAPDEDSRAWQLNQIFVHSKVLIIDDAWATVGSANLDGVSLQTYGDDFTSALGRAVFRGVRNIDVNLVADGSRDDSGATGAAIVALRTRLWNEHLAHELPVAETSSPLEHFRDVARRRIAQVEEAVAGRSAPPTTLLLPFSRKTVPSDQLADIGVRLATGRLVLCFNPSWLEVHCSPNWVRNMFA